MMQAHGFSRYGIGIERMDEAKKKRLTTKGWKVGNADEFLGLTPEEAAYVERHQSFDYQRWRQQHFGPMSLEEILTQVQSASNNQEGQG